ncbi:HRDC domain-containing protein [Parvularcula maris]|uniref:HRDC domain-containing protein n=1 Tax=Parvularcula maris TaxID=2965077 RepID=A0A9X2LAL2_9PROT|nr:HRDC domain-containing protein [Parvularcula maris]MCQ8186117.1 HRDC domain-containing protein [Parvularcula maris]
MEVGGTLLDRLRAWRRTTAKEAGVPAYVVLQNAALEQIAHGKPSTINDLRIISGVGAKRIEQYGEEILRLVAEREGKAQIGR